jgi:hypothetical protein
MRRYTTKDIVVGVVIGSYVALAGSGIVFAIVSLITDPNFRV